jgi:hypothetical protein
MGPNWVPGAPPPIETVGSPTPSDWVPGDPSNAPTSLKSKRRRQISVTATSMAALVGVLLFWPQTPDDSDVPSEPASTASAPVEPERQEPSVEPQEVRSNESSAGSPATAPAPKEEEALREEPTSLSGAPRATPATAAPASPATSGGPLETVLQDLASLPVRSAQFASGYDRDYFGDAWTDVDRNGCDTRNDVLRRDLKSPQIKPGTRGCLVLSGGFVDPYSGATMTFQRGSATSGLVQIDHVVALANAWHSGAHAWDDARRLSFANDPLNLLAVDGDINQEKSASDAAEWLPPLESAQCGYATQQITVKKTHQLSVTASEKAALADVLAACTTVELLAPAGDVPLGDG